MSCWMRPAITGRTGYHRAARRCAKCGDVIQWSIPLYGGNPTAVAPRCRLRRQRRRRRCGDSTTGSARDGPSVAVYARSSGRRIGSGRSGNAVLIVGFPLGFHDNLHHLPVARQAVIASAFGIRFQGQGYFLTDARMHRGTSGAPVVARVTTDVPVAATSPGCSWRARGAHGRGRPRYRLRTNA